MRKLIEAFIVSFKVMCFLALLFLILVTPTIVLNIFFSGLWVDVIGLLIGLYFFCVFTEIKINIHMKKLKKALIDSLIVMSVVIISLSILVTPMLVLNIFFSGFLVDLIGALIGAYFLCVFITLTISK